MKSDIYLPYFINTPSASKYRSFVSRVGAFVDVVTGHWVPVSDESDQTTNVQLFFRELRKYGSTKWEQFIPLYRKIQELNDTVESQKQMITALAYRHLIEHLPDQAYYESTGSENKGDKLNEKDYWKLVWENMVSQELSLMVKGDSAQRDLTTLFDYSFKLWRRDNKTVTSVPREKFREWPNYKRGEALYGELSNNIHLYQGKQETTYEVHDSNWSQTDRTILLTLRPKTWPSTSAEGDPELPSTVNWSAERKARGLPEKRWGTRRDWIFQNDSTVERITAFTEERGARRAVHISKHSTHMGRGLSSTGTNFSLSISDYLLTVTPGLITMAPASS